MNNENEISVLNDLLKITNDRIEGFSKVENKVWDTYSGLKDDYDKLVDYSQNMKSELIQLINHCGGKANDTTTTAGAIHRTWIDIKNSFAADKDKSTLQNVVFGEDAAIKAYQNALDSGNLSPETSRIILNQLHHLEASYRRFDNLEQIRL